MPATKASVTVNFSRPLTGAELIAAIKAISEANGERFESVHQFDDGDAYLIGQSSGYPYRQVRVSPSREEETIRPSSSYDQVVVQNHSWGGMVFAVGYSEGAVVKAVCDFGDMLRQHVEGQESEHTSSAWPQEVVVCAICEQIVSQISTGFYCCNDGQNPPTRTVKIAPLEP